MKEKGKSNYSVMLEPPEVKHAMEVAKNQSTVSLPPFTINLVDYVSKFIWKILSFLGFLSFLHVQV